MAKVWLVILLLQAGQPMIKLEDSEQPDIATCIASAAHVLEQAAKIEGAFEFVTQCSIVKGPSDPA